MSTLMHIVEEFTIDLELDRGGAREGKGKDAPWLRPDQEVGNRVFAFFPKLFRQQAKSFVQFFGHGRPPSAQDQTPRRAVFQRLVAVALQTGVCRSLLYDIDFIGLRGARRRPPLYHLTCCGHTRVVTIGLKCDPVLALKLPAFADEFPVSLGREFRGIPCIGGTNWRLCRAKKLKFG
jgi:hypothetical protein